MQPAGNHKDYHDYLQTFLSLHKIFSQYALLLCHPYFHCKILKASGNFQINLWLIMPQICTFASRTQR